MAVDLEELIERLQRKMLVLVDKYRLLESDKKSVDEENARLKAEIENLKKQLEQTNTDKEFLRIARNISNTPEQLAENKAVLVRLVRDVDKCIAQLTD